MARKQLVVNRGLKIGVEMEFLSELSSNKIAQILTEKGVPTKSESYNHNVSRTWKITTDSSVRGSMSYGLEIVSPILTDLEELKIVCETLSTLEKDGEVKVDRSCGVHIHHDINDFTMDNIKNLFFLYSKYEEAIDNFMPKSRRESNNVFCKSVKNIIGRVNSCETLEDIKLNVCGANSMYSNASASRSGSRYHKLNINSYIVYGTVEFRQHAGSLNFEKISNWIMITLKMLETAQGKKVKARTEARTKKWLESDVHMYYDFYTELGISGTYLSDYIRDRKKKLA
ncbi:MAG: amidoligase family protein [Cetobacterium sp.]